jgi:nucleoside-diphosphate-sugar epimerase
VKQNYPEIAGKKVLVTGATGYIGPHLCQRLMESGSVVFAVSRNYANHLDVTNMNYQSVDLADISLVRQLFKNVQPDYIFHLAGRAIGSRSMDVVESTFYSNLVTTLNILTAGTEFKSERIVITGSLEEPINDNDAIVPSSPYAASKWAASAYARMFNKLYQTPAVLIRLFMVYGPGKNDPHKLVPYVITKLLEGTPPELSSGKRNIDWIYIDDVIEGLIHAALATEVEGKTIDIGSGNLISTHDFVNQIQMLMHSKTDLLFGSLDDRQMEQIRKADIDKTYSLINWKPIVNLEEGLKKTIRWYQDQYQQEVN